MLSLYDTMVVTTGLFMMHVIYRAYHIVFEECRYNSIDEMACYLLYYVVTSAFFLLFNIPAVLLACNVLGLLLLAWLYRGSIKQRVLAACMVTVCIVFSELAALLVTGFSVVPIGQYNEYDNILGLVLNRIFCFLFVLFIGQMRNIRKGFHVSWKYWLYIIFMTTGCLYLCILLFQKDSPPLLLVLGMLIILMIFWITFFFYDMIMEQKEKEIRSKLVRQQFEFQKYQFRMMEESMKMTEALRHDWKNHICVLEQMIKEHRLKDSLQYFDKINDLVNAASDRITTGNSGIDSILNYKRGEAAGRQIDMQVEARQLDRVGVDILDMVVILGNLLDNAIEAVDLLQENRLIDIRLRQDKGLLYIICRNAYIGRRNRKGDSYLTTKSDPGSHGKGMHNIKSVISKYNGTIEICDQDGIFTVSLLLYQKQNV